MVKARRRKKQPVTTTATSGAKPKSSRTVIRKFHVLLKQKHQLEHKQSDGKTLADIDLQIDQLGGLESYQRMSAIGQGSDRGGGSERVAIPWLKEVHASSRRMLNLLEVGALKPDNYAACSSWLTNFPIDLHSRHPSILEQDFLLMDAKEHCERWDAISLSLVLNFVPDAKDRGRMLRLAEQFLVPGGYLFVALPFPCVSNSRYLTCERLKALMAAVGFVQVKERFKERGKMIYTLYQKNPVSGVSLEPFTKKPVLRQGDRNNFTILL
ncbi:nucleolus protein [Roridomyces roridus]|uniref:25S rRNA adenine-N(1) methyltransferase n=1 Tax=Roridomyces roridus TaxID=1738132 RepID=A0AAD7FQG0_9AGAR|nr:nucleolus protein [Roridomyces roridus]